MALKTENHIEKGLRFFEQGDAKTAKAFFKRATKSNPSDFSSVYLSALASVKLEQLGEARDLLERAIKIRPESSAALYNLGVVEEKLRRLDAAERAYLDLLYLEPSHCEALNNLGNICFARGNSGAAIDFFDRALAVRPKSPQVLANKGHILKEVGNLLAATDCYERALEIDPDHPFALGSLLSLKLKVCNWLGLEGLIKKTHKLLLEGQKCAEPLIVSATFDDPELNLRASKIFFEHLSPVASPVISPPRFNPSRQIVLGYFSSDFRNHAVSRLIVELLESHCRSSFKVLGFYYGPQSSGNFSERVRSAFDEFYDIGAMGDELAVDFCRKQGLHIAVDLNGHTQFARTEIFAKRLAPVQVNYLGFPGSMGSKVYDYLLSDCFVVPDGSEHFYSECIVRLPGAYQPNDSRRYLPARCVTRSDHGLPGDATVFCCFNNSWKILPEVFSDWMAILKRVEKSVLWLLKDNLEMANNLYREAGEHGVSPERIIFAPRVSYSENLERQTLADLFLDTFPYNAHTTASDALWLGLPVLTRAGQSFASRVAGSLLKEVGLDELVVDGRECYVDSAVKLGLEGARLQSLREMLLGYRASGCLFRGDLAAVKVEKAYRVMYQRAKNGLVAEPFQV